MSELNGKRPTFVAYFYLVRFPARIQMETLETLCLKALGAYISDMFSSVYQKQIETQERNKLLNAVTKQLQMITQSIPPLMANNFTSVVLKSLTTNTHFTNEDMLFDVHKKFLSVVLHPSVTSLHLPRMEADCAEYVYSKLLGITLTKVEVLTLEHCPSSSLQGFASLSHLHTIIFHNFCTDYFLENLSQSCGDKLRMLDIAYSGCLTAQSITALHKFQCLEDLNITRTGIKDGIFQRLAYGFAGGTLPPTLQRISCSSMAVSDLNVLTEGDFPNLKEICVEKLVPNKPIDKRIGSLKILILSFSSFSCDLLSMVGVVLTELHLIRVINLNAKVLISQCPNLSHLEVKMCQQAVSDTTSSTDALAEPINTELKLLKHLHLDTYYLHADVIFLQYGRNISHLTVIAEKFEEKSMEEFLKVLTVVPQKLITISFRSSTHDGLLSTDAVKKLMHLCPGLQIVEGVATGEDVGGLQKMNPSIKFVP